MNLDHSHKFRNFKNSSFAIRKISDRLCLENGLSVIEKPKLRRGHYGEWQKSQMELKSSEKFNLLMNVEEKIQQGYNQDWVKIQNLKDAAKTLVFLQENNLVSYEKLTEVTSEAIKNFNDISGKLKAIDARLDEISELQRYISNYSRTKDVYAKYKQSGWSRKILDQHEGDIILHRAAKNHFDKSGYGKDKKLPKIETLRSEYATLLAEKRKLYSQYKSAKENMIKLQTAKQNTDMILNLKPPKEHQRKPIEMSL